MPVKDDGKLDTGSPVSATKSKKTRYRLKKLLDRSRFSPRLLRIPRLTKSSDGNQDIDDEELKISSLNVDDELIQDSSIDRCNVTECGMPFNRQYAASVPLDPLQNSHSESNTQTPTGLSDPANPTPENLVEEEYEDTLTQFADLIIEGLKNSSSIRGPQPCDPQRQHSPRAHTDHHSNPASNLSLSLHGARFGSTVNGQLTPPLKFDAAVHPLSSIPAQPIGDEGAIYNEPCDAKPSPGSTLDDSVTIYTVRMFNPDPGEGSVHGSPHSSHSGVADSEIRALRLTNKPAGQGSCQPIQERPGTDGARSGADRPDPGEPKATAPVGTAKTFRSTTPCQQVSSTSPTLGKGQFGFVDAPRGNSVIVHHPASPFARVPRAPAANAGATVPGSGNANVSIESQKNNVPVPVSKLAIIPTNMAETNGTRSATAASQSVSTSGTLGSQSSGSPWKKAGLNSSKVDGNGTGHRSRSNTADTQPTYEEAWDLKMARQLGIGISRLTPVPKIAMPPAPMPTPVSNNAASDPRLALVACPKPVPIEPNSTGVSSSTVRPHAEQPNRSSLKFHENRLFDHRPHASKLKNDSTCAQPVSTATEYDYAYNGSWSMGVKLNLSLAMNSASETGDTTVPSSSTACRKTSNPNSAASLPYRATTTGSVVNATSRGASCINDMNNTVPALFPPHIPAHQTQFHENGQSGGGFTHGTDSIGIGPRPKRLEQAASIQASLPAGPVHELDNGSTDSYDESWETRHGRVVSELTSARFVDPSSLGLTEPTGTGSMRAVGQPLSVLTGTGCTESHQQVGFHTSQSHSTSPSAPVATTQVTPTGAGISPSVKPISTNLELLPLEEQPWFHRSLTRSEAEELLRNQPEGSFLVRNSETCPNDYSLTIKHKTLLHMKISRNAAGQYILGEYSKPYATVPQIIYHHARALVPVLGVESVTLTHPVCTRLP